MTVRTTNTEFMTELMEFSKHGALMQSFIIQAIDLYAKNVANLDPKEQPENGFISFESWQGCANEILEKLEERYKS